MQQITERLIMIKASIVLENESLLFTQQHKLNQLVEELAPNQPPQLQQIIEALDKQNYNEAMQCIANFDYQGFDTAAVQSKQEHAKPKPTDDESFASKQKTSAQAIIIKHSNDSNNLDKNKSIHNNTAQSATTNLKVVQSQVQQNPSSSLHRTQTTTHNIDAKCANSTAALVTDIAIFDDPDISALKTELAGLEQQLNQLHSKYNEHLRDVDDFSQLYSRRVGNIIGEILRLQMLLLQQQADDSNDDDKKQQLSAEYSQAQRHYQEYQQDYQQTLEQPEPTKLSKEDKKRLKTAFKQASKLCHPDMVTDELKATATETFQRLSDAYQNKDLQQVEDILNELQTKGILNTASTQVNDKVKLQEHIMTLRARIDTMQTEIAAINADETYQLISSLNGDYADYLAEREMLLKAELATLRKQLAA